jgi:hypothetical protein
MSIKKRLTQALALCPLVLSSYGYAQNVSLSLNKDTFATGDLLELSVAANAEEIGATEADVYISLQLPNGTLHYWHDFRIESVKPANEIMPLLTQWDIETVPEFKVFSFKVPVMETGTYKWYLTLAKTGSDVAQPGNWIANVSIPLVMTGGRAEKPSKGPTIGSSEPYSTIDGVYEEAGEIGDYDAFGDDGGDAFAGDVGGALGWGGSSAPGASSPPPAAPPPAESASTIASDAYAPADIGYKVEGGFDYADDEGMIDILPSPIPPFPDNVIPVAGTLTAGDIDDNLNFAAFQRYLNRHGQDPYLPSIDMSDRIALHIVNDAGRGVSNARIRSQKLDSYTGTDGRFYLFPQFDGLTGSQIDLQLTDEFGSPTTDEFGSPNTVFNTTLNLNQLPEDRSVTITLPGANVVLPYSLDVMFVIDATGSMSDELRYLITELRDIISAVQARNEQIRMRFGLVVYRDVGDEYVVRSFAFTDSLNEMQIQLNEQRAGGGGDYPEAMEQALEKAVNAEWSEGNVARLLFLVADAPPHDEDLKAMLEPVRTARLKGLRIYPLAASGVADKAEFMMRHAGILTQGRYLFLTDDSGVGGSHQEPSVSCYVVTRLNQLIARVIDSELAGRRVEPNDDDIIRSVGHYEAGVCADDNVIPSQQR